MTNRGAPTPPIEFAGDAAATTARFAASAVAVPDDVLARLGDACASVSVDPGDTAEAGRDWWPLAMHWALKGETPAP